MGHDEPSPAEPSGGLDDDLVVAIRALTTWQREVLILRVFFDLDTETTAALLGISVSAIPWSVWSIGPSRPRSLLSAITRPTGGTRTSNG